MERILAILIPILFLGGLFTVIGMKIRYSHIQATRISGSAQQEVEHLADAVEHLRAEVEQLNERMDFTERLLERPKTEE